jgi:hypothetical protein
MLPMYTITLISTDENERLRELFLPKVLYEIKSDIYGCCIKLLSDDHALKETWQENFYSMSQNVRSHGRLFVFKDPSCGPDTVLFDAHSRSAYLINFKYYGWIKSIALSLAGDILEDEHDIYSVHGACMDIDGKGLCIIGNSGAGKTTQTYGLLKDSHTRIVSDDWFFSRVYGPDILAYGSEKNFYIRKDLATVWKEYDGLVPAGDFDEEGRAVADLRWVIGKGRILPMTTLKLIILLKRDPADTTPARSLLLEEALVLFEENNYFNPHLLVNNPYKKHIRKQYITRLLERTTVYLVNTINPAPETQRLIRSLANVSQGP